MEQTRCHSSYPANSARSLKVDRDYNLYILILRLNQEDFLWQVRKVLLDPEHHPLPYLLYYHYAKPRLCINITVFHQLGAASRIRAATSLAAGGQWGVSEVDNMKQTLLITH